MNISLNDLYDLFVASNGICTDSRTPLKGGIFFALHGNLFDGNKYAQSAIDAGCAYAVIDDPELVGRDARFLYAQEGTLQTLSDLARLHRRRIGLPIIAITGTNGKTTTKELIGAVLKTQYNILITKGNLNNQIGVPLTLLRLTHEHQLAVIEMGASHPGDIAHLVNIAEPNYGLITNVGLAHLEGFGSMEGIMKTKGELYDYLRENQGTAFVCTDSLQLQEMIQGLSPIISYGLSSSATISGTIQSNQRGLLAFKWQSRADVNPDQFYSCCTHLVGEYNLANALAAVAVGTFFDISAEQICQALEDYYPTNERSQLVEKTKQGNRLIIDGYNANPSSMKVAIDNLLSMPLAPQKKRVLILGDMNELGVHSEQEHTMLLSHLSQQCTKASEMEVFLCGPHFFALSNHFASLPFSFFPSTFELAEQLRKNPLDNRLILFKGSNSLHVTSLVDLC